MQILLLKANLKASMVSGFLTNQFLVQISSQAILTHSGSFQESTAEQKILRLSIQKFCQKKKIHYSLALLLWEQERVVGLQKVTREEQYLFL